MRIPVIAELRETQNYIKASECGLGIHETGSKANKKDVEAWEQVINWLENDEQTNKLHIVADNT